MSSPTSVRRTDGPTVLQNPNTTRNTNTTEIYVITYFGQTEGQGFWSTREVVHTAREGTLGQN